MTSSSSLPYGQLFPAGDLFGPDSIPPPRRAIPTHEPWNEHWLTAPMTLPSPSPPVLSSRPPPPSSSSSHHGHHHSSSSLSSTNNSTTAAGHHSRTDDTNGSTNSSISGKGIPGIPNLPESMEELIRSLSPMVEEWRQRHELELEARMSLVADNHDISAATFKTIVTNLYRNPKLRLKAGGSTTLPGIDERIKFHGMVDQFFPLDQAGQRVRRTTVHGVGQTDLLHKIPQDTIDTMITPTKCPSRGPIPPKDLSRGLEVRFSTKREKPIAQTQIPSCAESAVVNIRVKERASFITEKGDFTIDCTRIRDGVTNDEARAREPTYEIEVEALRIEPSLDAAGKNPLHFANNFLFKCFSIIFGFVPTDAQAQVTNVNMRSARGRAVAEHYSAPSAYGGVRGDTAAMLEAKRASRHRAAQQRQAGASLVDTDQYAVADALSGSAVVVAKASEQARDAVAALGKGIDKEATTSPLYPVAMKKAKDSHKI